MTDETLPPDVAPPAPAVVPAGDLLDLMSRVEHDVIGQCWTLWAELKALVAKATA